MEKTKKFGEREHFIFEMGHHASDMFFMLAPSVESLSRFRAHCTSNFLASQLNSHQKGIGLVGLCCFQKTGVSNTL